ncbi:ROK family protein [Alkalihalobacillus sp. R86527]|uniref:ROK family protein n=1 Tax=Alkalihalobacillus sp. R86527 TaxID=3093863 RepID=UPI00366A8196
MTDESRHLLKVRQVPTEANSGYTSIIGRIVELIKELNETYKVETMVIGSPGPLNPFEGVFLSSPNLPSWNDVHVTEIVESEVDIPTFLLKDTDALGEAMYGAGKGKHDYKIKRS